MTDSLTPEISPIKWQTVPPQPTEEMHVAAVRTAARCTGNDDFPRRVYRAMLAAAPAAAVDPINMVLHCPKCSLQHVDAPEELPLPMPGSMFEGSAGWTNPPHKSHLCHGCGHIWRPADVPTNGVQAVNTTGKANSPIAAPARGTDAVLTDMQCREIYWALDKFGRDVCHYDYGLPELNFENRATEVFALMRDTATRATTPGVTTQPEFTQTPLDTGGGDAR